MQNTRVNKTISAGFLAEIVPQSIGNLTRPRIQNGPQISSQVKCQPSMRTMSVQRAQLAGRTSSSAMMAANSRNEQSETIKMSVSSVAQNSEAVPKPITGLFDQSSKKVLGQIGEFKSFKYGQKNLDNTILKARRAETLDARNLMTTRNNTREDFVSRIQTRMNLQFVTKNQANGASAASAQKLIEDNLFLSKLQSIANVNIPMTKDEMKQTSDDDSSGQIRSSQNYNFQISGDINEQAKVNNQFMDRAMKFSPEEILGAIKDFKDQMVNNPQDPVIKNIKEKLMTFMITASLGLVPQPASAIEVKELRGEVSYTQFMEGVKAHLIERVRIDASGKVGQFITDDGGRGSVALFNDPDLLQTLFNNQVDVAVATAQTQGGGPAGPGDLIASLLIPSLILTGIFFLFTRREQGFGMPGQMGQMGKANAKIQMEPQTGVTFDDVAGVNEAKKELTEMVDFLKSPARYTDVGAKIPRGALLIGPPGTGKTLLAKAVAGEAGVPFLSISASEFIEMFVGVGASRVRDLFKEAKKNAPCIVFIDELDAVGRQRNQGMGMGNDEREQTVNQLLTEMDGFEGNSGVIVLAATNIPDVLDSALTRPGRFDRQVTVGLPDLEGRTTILGVHVRGKPIANDVDLKTIAKRCLGMSGADLANVMNEAAIFSARKNKKEISSKDIYEAIDRIQIGLEKENGTYTKDRQKLVAYHEAGHAILGALMEEYDLVNKISIIPRGGAGGVTIFTPNEEASETGMYSKEFLENRICVAMGGRIAEEIINGKNKVTTGASNDFQQCTNTAKMMVEQMGMSDVIGPRNIAGNTPGGNRALTQGAADGPLRDKADEEIDRILREQYERGMNILTENRVILDTVAEYLIEKEKIDGIELLNVIKGVKPELITKQAMEAIEEVVKPELEAKKAESAEATV